MKKLILLPLIWTLNAFAVERINFPELCADRQEPSAEVKAYIQGRDYVFLHGYLNELYGNKKFNTYGHDNEAYLLNHSGQCGQAPCSTVSRKGVFSAKSILDNAVHFCEVLKTDLAATKARGKKLIIFGHSMGGGTIAGLVARCPELIADEGVEALVTIQGVLNGTPVADTHYDPSVKTEWNSFKTSDQFYRQVMRTVADRAVNFLGQTTDAGLESLGSAYQARLQSEFIGLSPEFLTLARNKVAFVSSEIDPDLGQVMVRSMCRFITVSKAGPGNGGANDCLVPVKSQINEMIGQHILHFEGASHLDLWIHGLASSRGIAYQRQCTYSFMNKLMDTLRHKHAAQL